MSAYVWGTSTRGALGTAAGTSAAGVPSTDSVAAASAEKGDPGIQELYLPTPLPVGNPLAARKIVAVTAGDAHSVAVCVAGNVFAWGRNKEGQVGQGERSEHVCVPARVEGLAHERAAAVAAGTSHTMCLTRSGRVYAFGAHYKRCPGSSATEVFGVGGSLSRLSAQKQQMIEQSYLAYITNSSDAVQAREDAPDSHASDTSVGEGERITIQDGGAQSLSAFQREIRCHPWHVQLPAKVSQIAAGHCFSAAIVDGGRLYTWGYNDSGQLGLGDRCTREEPTLVTTALGVNAARRHVDSVRAVCCGEQHLCVITSGGLPLSTGLGVFGQLGLGSAGLADRGTLELREVPSFALCSSDSAHSLMPPRPCAQVAAGQHHTVFLTLEGEIYACGHREYGQCGHTADEREVSPATPATDVTTDISAPPSSSDRHQYLGIAVPTLLDVSAALREGGEAARHVRGDGVGDDGAVGVRVVKVACGALHTVCLTDTGKVITFGWGGTGALGHGKWMGAMGRQHAATTARMLSSLSRDCVVDIAAGRSHSLALVRVPPTSSLHADLLELVPKAVPVEVFLFFAGPSSRPVSAVSPLLCLTLLLPSTLILDLHAPPAPPLSSAGAASSSAALGAATFVTPKCCEGKSAASRPA